MGFFIDRNQPKHHKSKYHKSSAVAVNIDRSFAASRWGHFLCRL